MLIGSRRRSLPIGALGWIRAGLCVGLAAAAAPGSRAQAQGPEGCIYANQNYSHGAIYGGTRCSRGTWINLSETEFRRLYPTGLGSAGASPMGAAPPTGPAPEPAALAPPTAPAPPAAPPTPGATTPAAPAG